MTTLPKPVTVAFAAAVNVAHAAHLSKLYIGNINNWIIEDSFKGHVVQELHEVWRKSLGTVETYEAKMFNDLSSNFYGFVKDAISKFGAVGASKLPRQVPYDLEAALVASIIYNPITDNMEVRYTVKIYQYSETVETPVLFEKDFSVLLMKTAHLLSIDQPSLFSHTAT